MDFKYSHHTKEIIIMGHDGGVSEGYDGNNILI